MVARSAYRCTYLDAARAEEQPDVAGLEAVRKHLPHALPRNDAERRAHQDLFQVADPGERAQLLPCGADLYLAWVEVSDRDRRQEGLGLDAGRQGGREQAEARRDGARAAPHEAAHVAAELPRERAREGEPPDRVAAFAVAVAAAPRPRQAVAVADREHVEDFAVARGRKRGKRGN